MDYTSLLVSKINDEAIKFLFKNNIYYLKDIIKKLEKIIHSPESEVSLSSQEATDSIIKKFEKIVHLIYSEVPLDSKYEITDLLRIRNYLEELQDIHKELEMIHAK